MLLIPAVAVHAVGSYEGRVFYDKEVNFILGEGSEVLSLFLIKSQPAFTIDVQQFRSASQKALIGHCAAFAVGRNRQSASVARSASMQRFKRILFFYS